MAEQNHDKPTHIRHSLSHLLAAAVREHFPNALPTIGPAIENGFYYDFDFQGKEITEDDLKKIQKTMRKMLGSWDAFVRLNVTADQARDFFKDNDYKRELIGELEKEEKDISLYYSGPRGGVPDEKELFNPKFAFPKNAFIDLCRGGHVNDPSKEIDPKAFKLHSIAGAYWRGDENNTMLTRIYGFAFETPEELTAYEKQLEEAKKRDHRKLGKHLDLFTFSELVGPGLPLWTPKGTLVRNLLDDYVWELRRERGYHKVEIPHITKKDLYEMSGHWDKFADELFRIQTREGHEFAMKPMNCPHHTQIFARKAWSYREIPQRYADTTMCYRDEQTGELHGLSRVRSFTQDDAHVFCREDQLKEETFKVWDIVETFYKTFGFDLSVRLSIHDPENMDKYLGDISAWESIVETFKSWLKERKTEYVEAQGEAAFYGPKIDFIAKDSIGREWQVATIQIDRNMPERFNLTYTNKDGKEEQVVMIHAAIMGSLERFLSVLIEHFAGAFPLWLSPVQVKVLPIGEAHHEFANEVALKLSENNIRADMDESDESLGKKIRSAKIEKVPYVIVIGDKEVEAKSVTVESRDRGNEGLKSIDEVVKELREEIEKRA